MKLPREVKIRIRPDGKVEIATVGFVGESCVKLSEILERALAGSGPGDEARVARELRPEYYIQEQTQDADATDRSA
jgi:hypothetical protein